MDQDIMNNVYILGAGASKEFQYPLIREILSTSYLGTLNEKIESIAPLDYKMTLGRRSFGQLENDIQYFTRYKMNFEELLLYFEVHNQIENKRRLLEYFQDLIILTDDVALGLEPNKQLLQFLLSLSSAKTNAIISFNYDLYIEHTLGYIEKFLPAQHKNIYQDNQTFGYFYEDNEIIDLIGYETEDNGVLLNLISFLPVKCPIRGNIQLLKLHGSLSLFRCRWCFELFYFPLSFLPPPYDKRCPSCGRDKWSENFIVPPNSKYISEYLSGLWSRASKILTEADYIYIIGYSFPDYDIKVRDMLYSSTINNMDSEVFIVNIDINSDLKDKCNKIFNNPMFINSGFIQFLKSDRYRWRSFG